MQNARREMTVASARAFWIVEPGTGRIQDEAIPALGAGELLVRTQFSAISRGTEALVFAGHVPESERSRMRAPFQAGEFPAPIKYGYCNVGVVEGGDAEWIGKRVFVLYPHQTRYVIPATAVHQIPATVPSSRAVLAANMETAVNGCWDANPARGDRVTVIGAGAVGCLVAWVVKTTIGCDVELMDVNPQREEVARKLEIDFRGPDKTGATGEKSVVIHTSGSEAGLRTALNLAAPDGTIVEMSWYGDRQVTLPLGETFHSRRLTIKSSQVGSIPPSRRAEWDTRRRMAYALSLLADPALDALITGESAFEDLPKTMERLAAGPADTICQRIRY